MKMTFQLCFIVNHFKKKVVWIIYLLLLHIFFLVVLINDFSIFSVRFPFLRQKAENLDPPFYLDLQKKYSQEAKLSSSPYKICF